VDIQLEDYWLLAFWVINNNFFMRNILDFYLSKNYIFHMLNIVFAVLIPLLICFIFSFSLKEILIESIIGIIMTFILTSILGGYKKLKEGYETYKKSN
jgi:VIT1/CCC1 family predicted Fe2+/Mn2+ transporter